MMGFLFSPYGRISRKALWLHFMLPYIGILIVATILDFALLPADPATGQPAPLFQGIVSLVMFWPSIAITTKRLHDHGWSGWWQLVFVIAIVLSAVAAYFYMAANGSNAAAAAPANNFMLLAIYGLTAVFLLFGLYMTILTMFLRGQAGANKYGEDPLKAA